MAGFVISAVGSAVVQEGVSRVVSHMLMKGKEESREHNLERLEAAHNSLELAMERARKFTITDRSLLDRRKMLERALEQCGHELYRSKLRALRDEEEEMADRRVTEAARSWSFPKRLAYSVKSRVSSLFTSSKKDYLSCYDVRRFERLAESADKFVRDVETGGSLLLNTFGNSLVRDLLEGKTLRYETVRGRRGPSFYIWPIYFEERGTEAQLRYKYDDPETPERNFYTALVVRLSEATDLVGIAIKCLRSWAFMCNLVPEFAMEQLATLATLEIARSRHLPWAGIEEEHTKDTRLARPNPLCCKANWKGPCTGNMVSSELSQIFSEQVVFFCFECHLSVLKYKSPGGSDEADTRVMGSSRTPLLLNVTILPHAVSEQLPLQSHPIIETIDTIRSEAIKYLFLGYKNYNKHWRNSKHGFVAIRVEEPNPETAIVDRITSSGNMTGSMKRKLCLEEIGEPHIEEKRKKRQCRDEIEEPHALVYKRNKKRRPITYLLAGQQEKQREARRTKKRPITHRLAAGRQGKQWEARKEAKKPSAGPDRYRLLSRRAKKPNPWYFGEAKKPSAGPDRYRLLNQRANKPNPWYFGAEWKK